MKGEETIKPVLRTAAGDDKYEEEDWYGWFHGIVVSGFRMQDAG